MFLTLILYFYYYNFIAILIAMWDPTENPTVVFVATCHFFILAAYLVQGLMMD
jgi:hypothetical protein